MTGKIILTRKENFFRPLFFENKQIEQIIIFNDKESNCVDRGWLENQKNYGKDVETMEFESLPVKRKVDLSNKFSFLAKHEDYKGDKVFSLFLYAPDLKTAVLKAYEMDDGVVYYKHLYFSVNGVDMDIQLWDHLEKNELGKQAELIEKVLSENRIKISQYDLIRFLKLYKVERIKNDGRR